jgi:hypothetical protein
MGYVYAFSTESMPGIFKIGMTKRTMNDILNDLESFFLGFIVSEF